MYSLHTFWEKFADAAKVKCTHRKARRATQGWHIKGTVKAG